MSLLSSPQARRWSSAIALFVFVLLSLGQATDRAAATE